MSKEAYGISMEQEVWRDVKGFEGLYQVSNYGRVKSIDRYIEDKNGNIRYRHGKLLSVCNIKGFKATSLTLQNKSYSKFIHKLVAENFIPDYNNEITVNFIDGDITNCRLDNLMLGRITTNSLNTVKAIHRLEQTTYFYKSIPVVQGGFGEGQRVLFDLTIADSVESPISIIRLSTIRNSNNLIEGIDYIDILQCENFNDYIPLLNTIGYSNNTINQSEHIFLYSERGYIKLISCMSNSNSKKWEIMNDFIDNYFHMREQLKEQQPKLPTTYREALESLLEEVKKNEKLEAENKEQQRVIQEQKPKVDKYEQYVDSEGFITPTVAAQLLKLPHATAQAFNKLLKEHGIQYKSGKNWVLYEKYNWMLEKDYCKQVPYIDSNGTVYHNLRWTPKGLDYIRDNILNKP